MKNKKAQVIGSMTGLAIGICIMAVVAILGIVVLTNFASSNAKCEATIGGGVATYNTATGLCQNSSGTTGSDGGLAASSAFYGQRKIGSSSGGLLTWLPVVIPAIIGISIIGYFMFLGGRKQGY